VIALCAALACDSTQPDQTGAQNLSIDVFTVNAPVPVFEVWDVFLDNFQCEGVSPTRYCLNDAQCADLPGATGRCIPDGRPNTPPPPVLPEGRFPDGLVDVICAPPPPGGRRSIEADRRTPWNFAIEIEMVRAGETEGQPLTDTKAATDPGVNLTAYDNRDPETDPSVTGLANLPNDVCPPVGLSCTCTPGVSCTFQGDIPPPPPPGGEQRLSSRPFDVVFTNHRELSGAHRRVLESGAGLDRFQNSSGGFELTSLCPNHTSRGVRLGDSGIFGPGGRAPLPFTTSIRAGDTVVVRVRKPATTQGVPVQAEPVLASEAFVGGQFVKSAQTGGVPGTQVEGAFTYSVTSR
jgi:hypothetical protein